MSPVLPRRLLQTQSDARLIELARAGHERAFEALVRRYRKPLLRYCQRMLLPESRAEDAIQQALLSAWSALQQGVEVADAQAWLYRIVHNTAVSALRKSGYDYDSLSESLRGADAPDEDLERRIAVREALAGIAGLPQLQREVLLRTAVEGQSHEQVADALGLSDSAVRGMVYRARATLRAAATALTPPPLAAWAACVGVRGVPVAQRIGEAAVPGSAGVAGVFLKGGAVALTAGSLVTGTVLVHHHHRARVDQESSASVNGRSSTNSGEGGSAGVQTQDGGTSRVGALGADGVFVRFAHGQGGRGKNGLGTGILESGAWGGGVGGRGDGQNSPSEHHHGLGSQGLGGASQGGGDQGTGQGGDGAGHRGDHGGSGGGASGGSGRDGGSGRRGSGASGRDGGSGGATPHEAGSGGSEPHKSGDGSGSRDGSPSGAGSGPSSVPTVVPGSGSAPSGGPPSSHEPADGGTPPPSGPKGTTGPSGAGD
jgi:RNA polymerase sigma factor (sigma-70 family)